MKWALAVTAVVAVALAAWRWVAGGRPGTETAYPIPGERFSYAVEVLNATGIDGLARDVTRRLRRAGIDVVSFGSAPGEGRDSTALLVRRGDSTAALAVRAALGFGRVVSEPNPRLLLDVTVLLGRDAAPPDRDP